MKINKILKLMLVYLILVVGMVGAVYSASSLNVVLANQNPDPVSPGNFVELNVKVANSGANPIKDAKIQFVENSNFKVAEGKLITKDLGQIPAYSSLEGSSSYVIAKFLIKVSPNTPLGLNPVKFNVISTEGTYSYEFDLSIQDQNPTLKINSVNVETIEAGKSSKLVIELENANSISLKNVILDLNLAEVDETVLSTLSGSNQKVISTLSPGEKKSVEFNLVVSPDAESKPYLLPITINYEDSLENSFSTDVYGSVKVYSEPIPLVKLDSQEIYTKGVGRITLAISNPGTSSVKGTQIEILPSEDYSIIGGDFQYVGDLNPDDFQTVQIQTYINNPESATLKVKITYLDSYNVQNEKILDIPLKIYTQEELVSFGLETGNSSSGFGSYILALIVGIVAFFVGRKLGFKKGKSRR